MTQSPFAVLTFIVAPAILTNAASVLPMSTINRMLRTRERMQQSSLNLVPWQLGSQGRPLHYSFLS